MRCGIALTAVLITVCFSLLTACLPARAEEAGMIPKIILISIPGVDTGTLVNLLRSGRLPHTQRLVDEGASGLMNSVTGRRLEPADAYATLGAGRRIAGGPYAGAAYDRDEKTDGLTADIAVIELYRTRLGFSPPPPEEGAVLHTGIAAMTKESREAREREAIGSLGRTLRAAGLRAAVLGNADYRDPETGQMKWGRWAAAIAMDDRGVVPAGSVGPSILMRDPGFPGGVATDYERLKRNLLPLITERVSLIVVETGDTWRVQAQGETLSPRAYAKAMAAALRRLDTFLGWLMPYLDPGRDMIILLSPSPSSNARQMGDSLLPVVIWGQGITPGLLLSGTTHRPGLIANIDIAPTILSRLNLAAPGVMTGRPVASKPAEGPLRAMDEIGLLHDNALSNHLRRPVILKAYISLQIAVLLGGAGAAVAKLPLRPWFGFALLSLTAGPLAFLLLGAAPWLPRAESYASVLAITIFLTALAAKAGRGNWLASFTALAIATTTAVAMDALQGSRFMSMSPLGHSLIGGARFYGIGNEYMGVLIGSALVGGSALAGLRPWLRWAVTGTWAALLGILSWPSLGANFGGGIAAAAGFSYAATRLHRSGPAPSSAAQPVRALSLMAAGAAAIMAAAITWDSLNVQDAQTHVGQALRSLTTPGGWEEAMEIIQRKVLLNWRLMRWTNWSLLFLVSLGIYAWISLRPPESFRRLLGQTPDLTPGLSGVAIGSITALVFNDSGVVAAATCMIFASAPLLFLVLRSNGERCENAPDTRNHAPDHTFPGGV